MRKPIRSFKDLEVYQRTLKAAFIVLDKIVPKLKQLKEYDLANQMSRACKAVPTLIGEGYAKKHQKRGFQKYLNDALGECNEMITHLVFCKDAYRIDPQLCEELIETYDISGKQIYRLRENWDKNKKGAG